MPSTPIIRADAAETFVTAPTRHVEVGESTFGYRSIGTGRPLVLFNRFRGTIDDWDPLTNDLLAKTRQVIVFDNVGVGFSSGVVPPSVRQMALDAIRFLETLFDEPVDIMGFSLGGYVAQLVTLERPDLVRKMIMAGTGPGVGTPETQPDPSINQFTTRPSIDEVAVVNLFFTDSEESKASGHAHWARTQQRTEDRAPEVRAESVAAQIAAVAAWRSGKGSAYADLGSIRAPVLIANGDQDRMVPTLNSWLAFQRIPNAELVLYPDSGHGFHYQYPDAFVEHATRFLDKDWYEA